MRAPLSCLLLLATVGCAVPAHTLREKAMHRLLSSTPLPVSLEQARAEVERLPREVLEPQAPPCELCVEEIACEDGACGVWLRSGSEPLVVEFERVEGSTEAVNMRFFVASNQVASRVGARLWGALDAAGLQELEASADAAVASGRLPEAPGFSDGWTLQFAAVSSISMLGATGGVRIGAQRWHSPHLLTGYALELGLTQASPLPVGRSDFLLAPVFRVGLSSWSEESDRFFSLPGPQLYAYASPFLLLFGGQPSGGWRAGVGGALGPYTPSFHVPLLLEVGARQQVTATQSLGTGVEVTVGVGL